MQIPLCIRNVYDAAVQALPSFGMLVEERVAEVHDRLLLIEWCRSGFLDRRVN